MRGHTGTQMHVDSMTHNDIQQNIHASTHAHTHMHARMPSPLPPPRIHTHMHTHTRHTKYNFYVAHKAYTQMSCSCVRAFCSISVEPDEDDDCAFLISTMMKDVYVKVESKADRDSWIGYDFNVTKP